MNMRARMVKLIVGLTVIGALFLFGWAVFGVVEWGWNGVAPYWWRFVWWYGFMLDVLAAVTAVVLYVRSDDTT